jgi:hypothetical protein
MVQLLEDLQVKDAVACMSMHDGRFYDVWGHRGLDGYRFTTHPPYHVALERSQSPLVEIMSAGSCVVMRPEVAKVARFGSVDGIVGLGRSIRMKGFTLWLDRRCQVTHP